MKEIFIPTKSIETVPVDDARIYKGIFVIASADKVGFVISTPINACYIMWANNSSTNHYDSLEELMYNHSKYKFYQL